MNPKVTAAAIAGAIVTIIMAIVDAVIVGPLNWAPELIAAMTTIVMLVVGYLVPETWTVALKKKPDGEA
ncbi:MAG: hypothetical protein GY906_24090 [bacterium]|nr:hypothetical protein [bacterium]